MLIYNFFIVLIYIFQTASYYTKSLTGSSYSEIYSKSLSDDESDTYQGKDYDNKSPYYIYSHLLKIIIKKNKFNGDKKLIYEYANGHPKSSYTYDTFFNRVLSFSDGLNTYDGTGIQVKKYNEEQNDGMFRLLGLYGSNSANWITADISCMLSGVTTVVMHSKFSLNEIVDILNEVKLEWLCLDLDFVENLLSLKSSLPHLKKLIILDTFINPSICNTKGVKSKYVDEGKDVGNNDEKEEKEIQKGEAEEDDEDGDDDEDGEDDENDENDEDDENDENEEDDEKGDNIKDDYLYKKQNEIPNEDIVEEQGEGEDKRNVHQTVQPKPYGANTKQYLKKKKKKKSTENLEERKKLNMKRKESKWIKKHMYPKLIYENIDLEDICEDEKKKIEKLKYLKEEAKKYGIQIIQFNEMLINKNNNMLTYNIQNDKENFIYTIVYTSGTSGRPKGVMISNKNIYYTVIPLSKHSVFTYNVDTHLSYLPLSHIYERVNIYLCFVLTVEIHIWSKNLNYFSSDILVSKSSFLVGVPKVFNRIYNNVITEIGKLPFLKKFFVEKILSLKRSNMNGKFSKFIEAITNMSKKIRSKINPNLNTFITGGGKTSTKVISELSLLLNVSIQQGYGLTETTGPLFVQHRKDKDPESTGGPLSPHVLYKVQTWEIYNAKDILPRGELLVKGDCIFHGYFTHKDITDNSFTEDKFFKTGDIVQINKNGSLTFLDRSKGLLKLAQGEYIQTDMLNNLYSEIPFINHCIVYADETLSGPIAVVSIDKELFIKHLLEDNIISDVGTIEEEFLEAIDDEQINSDVYVNYVKQKMLEAYKKTNLNGYNIINHIYLTVKVWDTSNYLTPTFKIKRFHVFRDYAFFIDDIKKLYSSK
ncbi:acyl-CoA synthetase [Plasmodium reichenowi]|uniref:Acyl-CoA synthetase n=1 Tax=Plasmodium reichenowi TaxID=5854 RepID=A0A2P9D2X6_PLARE|nr:acyl-CoA synthetase [Plasmodium reichenowi]